MTSAIDRLREANRRAVIITMAMLSTVAFYVLIAQFLMRSMDAPPGDLPVNLIRYVAFGMAFVTIFGVHVLRVTMTRAIRETEIGAAIDRLTRVSIVTATVAQVPGTLGFAIFFIARQSTDLYMLCFVSIYLLLRHFPRMSQWEEVARPALGGLE